METVTIGRRKFEYSERVTLPRVLDGADWGVKAWLLLEDARGKRLFWVPGHTDWAGVGSREFCPGHLVMKKPDSSNVVGERVFEGGRLTKARLLEHAKQIDAFFGIEVARHLDPKQTLVPASLRPREKMFNGKPMSHWEHEAKKVVVEGLVRAADLDTRSVIGRLARERLIELAKAEDAKIYEEILGEHDRFIENVGKVLASASGGKK